MTDNTSNRAPVILSAGEAFGIAQNEADAKFTKVCIKMKADKIDPADISKGGAHLKDFTTGLLIGWQGADFADVFATSNGKVMMTGKVYSKKSGRLVNKTQTRQRWQNDLSSKVAKARKEYTDFLDGPDAGNGEKAARKTLLQTIENTGGKWHKRLIAIKDDKAVGDDAKILADVSELITAMAKVIETAKKLDK